MEEALQDSLSSGDLYEIGFRALAGRAHNHRLRMRGRACIEYGQLTFIRGILFDAVPPTALDILGKPIL